jgi:radical SAM superfamily enzyme YgiQ (UPF0313 family)
MTKILLIKVPTSYFPSPKALEMLKENYATCGAFAYGPPLALALIAGSLKHYLTCDFELTVKDLNTFSIPEKKFLMEEYFEHILNVFKDDNDIVLISCQYMFNQSWVNYTVDLAHKLNPNAKIIVGGGFPTIFPEKAVSAPSVDYAVIGEGEVVIVHIINKILGITDSNFENKYPFDGYAEKLPNGKFKIVEKKTFITDLENHPTPDWSWLPIDIVVGDKADVTFYGLPVMCTRGCPHNCSFCSTRSYWGRRFIYDQVVKVINEILSIYKQYGINKFHIIDDNPALNNKWFLNLCKSIQELPEEINIMFSNFSIESINSEIIEALKNIRQEKITIAIETGSQEMQKTIKKHLNLENVIEKVKLIRKNGLKIHACWMIGFPNETLDQIKQTTRMAVDMQTDSIQVWPVFPFPGTELYREAKGQNLINLDENDFDTMRQHTPGKILSSEWDGKLLSQIAYDTQMEANFLNNPVYDTESGMRYMRDYLKGLIIRLPDQPIISICLGYLEHILDKNDESQSRYYHKALGSLNNESSFFKKYVNWDFPQLNDFKSWLRENHEIVR